MNTYIGSSLTAAGVTFNIEDFRDPHLGQLTPIQVDKSGRVFGHLAGWKTNHIGMPGAVKPPRSATGYKYFHQSVVPTTEGDLPVGHLTLGTGHAGQGDAMTAASHYDNTGAQVASVRAGEDQFGIWVAGRVHPGTDDMQRQTLRRSSLSGDWRKIVDPDSGRASMELVAALAVNVPGFPIPRTEQLVAAGNEPTMLVAAGIVRNGPVTVAEVEAMVAAAGEAAQKRVELAFAARDVRARAAGVLDRIVADGRARQRDRLTAAGAQVRRDRLADRFTRILAAGVESTVNDATGHMPSQLHRYWTSGAGLARWAPTPTPYRSLVSALTQEVEGMTPEQIKGLAANLYHDVFGTWPGRQNKGGGKLAASATPPTPDEATAIVADMAGLLADQPIPTDPTTDPDDEIGEMIVDEPAPRTDGMVALLPAEAPQIAIPGGEPADELHLTLVYLGDGLDMKGDEWRQDVARSVVNALQGEQITGGSLFGRAEFNANNPDKEQCAVWLVDSSAVSVLRAKVLAALGDRVPPSDYGAWIPHITAGYGMPADGLPTGVNVAFDRVRIAIAGSVVDVPIGQIEADTLIGEVAMSPAMSQTAADTIGLDGDEIEAAGRERRAQTQQGADKYGVSIGDVIGKGVDDAVDSATDTAQAVQRDVTNVAKAVGEAIFGKRKGSKPDTPKAHDEPKAKAAEAPAAKPVENKAAPPAEPAPAAKRAQITPAKGKSDKPVKPSTSNVTPPAASTPPTIPADAPAPRKDVGAGSDHQMEEDESPDTGALGGKLISYSDGRADYDDGSWTDGNAWHVGDPPKGTPDAPATRAPAAAPATADTSPPNVEITATDVPPRQDVGAGTDHPMEEDESPATGAEGGKLVDYGDGVARYDDGTETDGNVWTRSPVLPGMGYDGQTMLEDQSPLKGAEGGDLVSYGDGVAVYSDGTETDGKQWRRTQQAAA